MSVEGADLPAVPEQFREEPGGGSNLRLAWDSFVGRHRELADLERLLDRHRLITLVGPPGAGKTRLVLEFAARMRQRWPDGVWLVELAALRDGDLLPQTVAKALGVREHWGESMSQTLVAALRGRRALLVLDNCEHLLEPCAGLVEVLLGGCVELRVVVTSRETLRVPGERVFAVTELSLPEPGAVSDVGELMRADAVRLFCERAQADDRDFQLTEDAASSVARICWRLDGLPLAIELAARRVRLLTVEGVLARLDDRFGLLTVGRRTALAKDRDLRTTIEWSHQLLAPDEQAVFRRLSVFAGQFDLDAAVAVCGGAGIRAESVLDLVTSLDAKSLVARVPGTAGFRQLESIRAYARERLEEAGELDATIERLVAWLTGIAEPLISSVLPSPKLLPWLDGQSETLSVVVEWTASTHDERHALLAAVLAWYWRHRGGYLTEGSRLVEQALGRTATNTRYRSVLLADCLWLAMAQRKGAQAQRLAQETIELTHKFDQTGLLARVLLLAANNCLYRAEFAAALAHCHEGLAITRGLGDSRATVWASQVLVWAAVLAGELDQAAALLDELLPILQAQQPSIFSSHTLNTAGVLALFRDELATAEEYFIQALLAAAGYAWGMAAPLEGLAIVAIRRDESERGLHLIATARAIREVNQWLGEPSWQRLVNEAMAAAEGLAGPDRAAIVRAEAARWTPEQAIAFALHHERPDEGGVDLLGDREREVVALVGEGLTNHQIAQRLAVSERTVVSVLRGVRSKLDLPSRAHLVEWVRHHQDRG